MSSHALDNQMEERLLNEIDKLKKRVTELRTMQPQGADAVNMTITPYQEITYTLDHNSAALPYFHLQTDSDKPLFSVFEYDLCVGSWSEANLRGSGLNNFSDTWDVEHNTSQGYSHPEHIFENFLVRNRSGSTQTFILRGRWRYIVTSATGGTS